MSALIPLKKTPLQNEWALKEVHGASVLHNRSDIFHLMSGLL